MAAANRIISSHSGTVFKKLFPKSRRSAVHSLSTLTSTRTRVLPPRRTGKEFRSFSSSNHKSPFDSNSSSSSSSLQKRRPRRKLKFVPQKAAVKLTPKARNFFRALLESTSDKEVVGIMLNYHQSSTGEPRMVFSFDFCKASQLTELDEGVSLEVLEDGVTPKSPEDSENDGLPKLYVNHNAFMKVLGCTLDIDEVNFVPLLYDREGNKLDPNA